MTSTPSVDRLVKLWADFYVLELPFSGDVSFSRALSEASSPSARAQTISKLNNNVLDIRCQMAFMQTQTLYSYIPNVFNLSEAKRITQFAFRVYNKVLKIYQQHSFNDTLLIAGDHKSHQRVWNVSTLMEVAYELEPILTVFQEQHKVSKDWRALGFMSTQLNFTNKLILQLLTPVERALLKPYLKFVEDQASIPWQQVCAAAAKYQLDSDSFIIVEQMLPMAEEIAQAVYHRLTQLFPDHKSRRGGLDNPDVAHSCLRDLKMFQAYFWLCVLEESMATIEQELLPLCIMVMAAVQVKQELSEQWTPLLIDEIIRRVNPEQGSLLQPYTQKIQEIFSDKRHLLGDK